jgi:DNA-binding CsgD family transcriptional regulator
VATPRFGRFQPPLALTEPERRILGLALEGLDTREIASATDMDERTVRYFLRSVSKKLEVFSKL